MSNIINMKKYFVLIIIFSIWVLLGCLSFYKPNIPSLKSYGFSHMLPHFYKGLTDPMIIGYNDSVRLCVDDNAKSVLGLFRNNSFVVIPITSCNAWKNTFFETIPDSKTWDLSLDHFHPFNHSGTFSKENVRCTPWIKFKVPSDSTLIGTEQKLLIKMDYIVPQYLPEIDKYDHYRYSINDTFQIHIGTIQEQSNFKDWKQAVSNQKKIGLTINIIGYIFGGLLILFCLTVFGVYTIPLLVS